MQLKMNKWFLFLIVIVFLSGCGIENKVDKDLFKERNARIEMNSIQDLHQGINILKEEREGYIFGAYVKEEDVIYFEALRGEKNPLSERFFFDAPVYGIDTVIRDKNGEAFSITAAGQHPLSEELISSQNLKNPQKEEAWNKLRETSVQMIKELSVELEKKDVLSSNPYEKEALLVHTQGIKRTLEEGQKN